MNRLIQYQVATLRLVIAGLLACFLFLPMARAVVPPPDGGYPGQNTAEGQNALLNLTTGHFNTAVGAFALRDNTTGNYNTAIGMGSLVANTADWNTATGAGTLFSNIGEANTANGAGALLLNTVGFQNTATGAFALLSNTIGQSNSADGFDALSSNSEGSGNTANGSATLFNNTIGDGNTAVGAGALFSSTGEGADFNTAVGFNALVNTSSYSNTAVGADAGANIGIGWANTAIGINALSNPVGGSPAGATAIGAGALANSLGFGNIGIGYGAGDNITAANNVICIGANLVGANVDNSCYISNIWNQAGGSQAVYVNSEGKLGFQVSSHRFKDEIRSIEHASEVIYGLRPVSFRYKAEIEPTRPLGYGLIAEDVEKISRDLVTRDDQGKPKSVRYDAVNAMLLNEFLKEHRTVQELRKEVAALAAIVKQQAEQLEKVSAGIEMGKVALNAVRNNQ